jgi:hypothetical protein
MAKNKKNENKDIYIIMYFRGIAFFLRRKNTTGDCRQMAVENR